MSLVPRLRLPGIVPNIPRRPGLLGGRPGLDDRVLEMADGIDGGTGAPGSCYSKSEVGLTEYPWSIGSMPMGGD